MDTEGTLRKSIHVFHMCNLRGSLKLGWQYKVLNRNILQLANIESMLTLLKQRGRVAWLGHTTGMKDGRLPKDLLYGEFNEGKRPLGSN